jgi:PAS domain S-box-containing protein
MIPQQSVGAGQTFDLLVDAATDYAIYVLDAEGLVTSWNAGAERLLGYADHEVLGHSYAMFFTEEDRCHGQPEHALRQAAAAGRFENEGWRVRRDGSRFRAAVVLNAIPGSDGALLGFAKVTRDMSPRQRMEARFRQVVEWSPSAMVMINRKGLIEMVNAQTERLFGYSRDELLGRSVEMLVPQRVRDRHPGLRGAFFAEPAARPMGAGRDLYAVRKDGGEFPVEIGLNPIETEEGPMVLSAIVDISARKRMEARFRQAVESAPNAMVMVNQAGLIELVNAQTEHLFGYGRKELLGQPVEMLMPRRFRDGHPGLRGMFNTAPQARPMGGGRDLYALRKDGSEFPVEIGLNPIETEDGTMVLSAIVDISDRKHKEESIHAALREKDVLLGEIHHRVKNNLQIIHSLLDLQSGKIADPTVLEMVRESQNRIKSMALIHQTLYESKDFARVDFRTFLEAFVPQLVASYAVNTTAVELSLEASSVLLPINLAIPCGLVVNELISNALKHAFPAGRAGEISVKLTAEPDGKVALTVSDDGVGLPDGFDANETTTLGLQLVTLLADQLGAKLSMRRADPTTFTLRFLAQH